MFVTPTFTAENTPIWPSVTVSGQTPSTGGWRVPASPEVVGLGLGWLNEATVGDPTALAALYARFHVDAPTGPLSPKKKPWEITLGYPAPFEDTTHRTCAAQPALEPSPLGQAYPVIWQLSAGDDIFGVGCGYVGVATRPVSGPTPFSQTFVLTDAKLSPTRYDVACAGGKVVDNAPACVPPKVVGLLLGTATKRLKSANCRVGRITRVYSRKIARGRVVTQIPAPRTYLPAGFGVLLTVSRGRK
jgi:hypothetical protein